MKKLILILFLGPLMLFSQQIGGAGHAGGYYRSIASVNLTTQDTTQITNASEWYVINAPLVNGHNVDFTLDSNGVIYTRADSSHFIFMGSGNAITDKSCEVALGLFRNSDTDTLAIGYSYFHNANQIGTFASTKHLSLQPNDTLKVKVTSNQANTQFILKHMNMTILQVH